MKRSSLNKVIPLNVVLIRAGSLYESIGPGSVSLLIYYFPDFIFSQFSITEYSAMTVLTSSGLANKKLSNLPKVLSDFAIIFWGGYVVLLRGAFPRKEERMQRLASLHPFSQAVYSLLRARYRIHNTQFSS
jgi:hypothetical protein